MSLCIPTSVMGRPRILALPEVGKIIPINNLIVVDFPAPLGPKNPNDSPSSIRIDRFSRERFVFRWRKPVG